MALDPTWVTASSAMVSAIATVVVAGFSIGTLKIYRLERSKRAAQKGRLAAMLGRLQADTHGVLAEARKAAEDFGPLKPKEVRKRIARWKPAIDTAWQSAAEFQLVGVMANLHVAEVVVEDISRTLDDLEPVWNVAGPKNLRDVAKQLSSPFLDDLARLATAVSQAIEALPDSMRKLEGDPYIKHLDRAMDETLETARRLLE